MKNKHTIFLSLITLLLTSTTFAQNRARVFDNFDTSSGVKIVSPTVAPIVKQDKPVRKRSKKKTMSVSEGYGVRKTSYSRSSTRMLTMGTGRSMKGFSTGDATIDGYILESSLRYNIDPLLIYAQMHQESAFKKRARSHKGASGLMQLMPATARRFGVTKIYDPKQNIDAGVKYMRWLLNKFNGNVVLALAGYNAGEGAVMKYGWNVPPYRETRNYVKKITRRYNAISNPAYSYGSSNVGKVRGKAVKKKEAKKNTVTYQADVLAIRLPNGRMRLVTN